MSNNTATGPKVAARLRAAGIPAKTTRCTSTGKSVFIYCQTAVVDAVVDALNAAGWDYEKRSEHLVIVTSTIWDGAR